MPLGPPDLRSTVASFSVPIVVRDYLPSTTTVEGLIASNGYTDTPTTGHPFPAAASDIQRLELQSPGAVIECHTPAEDLRVAVKGSTERGSVIVWQSREYEVRALGEWWAGPAGTDTYQQVWAQEVRR